jgi:hypothetical protein
MAIAADYEAGAINYDYFLSRTSTTVSADPQALAERLTALAADPELRRRLGAAGAERARRTFDWAVVYRQYQALWRELEQRRVGHAGDPALRLDRAPRSAPDRPDPFRLFAHYPTRQIGPQTRVRALAAAGAQAHRELTAQTMLSFWKATPEQTEQAFAALGGETLTLAELADRLGEPLAGVIERMARFAKMELVELSPPVGED